MSTENMNKTMENSTNMLKSAPGCHVIKFVKNYDTR